MAHVIDNSLGRYFFAVRSAQWAIEPRIKDVAMRLKRDAKERDWDCNWVAAENYHVTVFFLGSLSANQIQQCHEVGKGVASQLPRFSLEVTQLGAFPEIEVGRVLWLGVRKSIELAKLNQLLSSTLSSSGIFAEDREFQPHLTLCRLRSARNLKDWMSPFRRRDFGEYEVSRLELMQSQVFGPRIVHMLIASWDFSGSGSAQQE